MKQMKKGNGRNETNEERKRGEVSCCSFVQVIALEAVANDGGYLQ
jgi:hypothetical protein